MSGLEDGGVDIGTVVCNGTSLSFSTADDSPRGFFTRDNGPADAARGILTLNFIVIALGSRSGVEGVVSETPRDSPVSLSR